EATPQNLRNVVFALQVGAEDKAFGRNEVAARWGKELDRLHEEDPNGYTHYFKLHEGKGHWMDRQDAAALPWLAKFRRDPLPDRVVWKLTALHDRSYWLAVPPGKAAPGASVIAKRTGQAVEIQEAEKLERLLIRLDDRGTDLDQP